MADEKDNRPNINISSGNIQAGISNIGGNQTFQGPVTSTMGDLTATMNAIPTADQSDKMQLDALLTQLQDALKAVPAENQNDAQKLADRIEELVKEASQPELDKAEIEHKANRLKQAAENIQAALPVVFPIAISIVEHILKLGVR